MEFEDGNLRRPEKWTTKRFIELLPDPYESERQPIWILQFDEDHRIFHRAVPGQQGFTIQPDSSEWKVTARKRDGEKFLGKFGRKLGSPVIRATGWRVGAGTIQDPSYVREAFARIADRYVTTNHVLSLGTDILWRRKVARIVRAWKPRRVLDVATGTGDLALEIQDACPDAEVTGSDFCAEMLAHAGRRGLARTLVADALALPFRDGEFDVVTVAFGLRNMADYAAAIREMRRVLRPGGHLLILDFSLPEGVMRKPYRWYLHNVLPKLAGALTGQKDAYEYLGGSIEEFPMGGEMGRLLERQGFHSAVARPLTCGVATIYTAKS